MARVIEIVKAHLEANGFDGLVQTDAECGCLCDDLAPCGGEFGQCEPAYRGADLSGEHGDWAMYTSKEDARNSCAEALLRHNAVTLPTKTTTTARQPCASSSDKDSDKGRKNE